MNTTNAVHFIKILSQFYCFHFFFSFYPFFFSLSWHQARVEHCIRVPIWLYHVSHQQHEQAHGCTCGRSPNPQLHKDILPSFLASPFYIFQIFVLQSTVYNRECGMVVFGKAGSHSAINVIKECVVIILCDLHPSPVVSVMLEVGTVGHMANTTKII